MIKFSFPVLIYSLHGILASSWVGSCEPNSLQFVPFLLHPRETVFLQSYTTCVWNLNILCHIENQIVNFPGVCCAYISKCNMPMQSWCVERHFGISKSTCFVDLLEYGLEYTVYSIQSIRVCSLGYFALIMSICITDYPVLACGINLTVYHDNIEWDLSINLIWSPQRSWRCSAQFCLISVCDMLLTLLHGY